MFPLPSERDKAEVGYLLSASYVLRTCPAKQASSLLILRKKTHYHNFILHENWSL
jgi:hypothetical protein